MTTTHEERDASFKEAKRLRRKAAGKIPPTRAELLYAAMIPAFKAGMTIDQVRELVVQSMYTFCQGVAIPWEDFEKMLVELSAKKEL